MTCIFYQTKAFNTLWPLPHVEHFLHGGNLGRLAFGPVLNMMNTIKLNFYFLHQICIFYLGCFKRCVSFSGSFKKRQMSWQAYVLSYWQTWEYSSPSLKPSHSIKNNRTKNRKIYLKRERFQNPSSRIALYHNVYFSNLDELFTF